MSGMHFNGMAADYEVARPPYPRALFDLLLAEDVTGPGKRLLEIGAGTGQATTELVRSGASVTALEPGTNLAALLHARLPAVTIQTCRLEDADLPRGGFDAAVAATSMHWVDLAVGLPMLHAALAPRGRLVVWRHRFSSHVETEFRRRVSDVVAARHPPRDERARPNGSTMDELAAGGWFTPARSEQWEWSIDLDTDQVRRLFRTFSDWTNGEVDAVAQAADDLGGVVTEHYRTVLHLLTRADDVLA